MEDSVLQLINVTKIFKQAEQELSILKNACLNIKKGEIVGLLGQSGSGKTTILQIAGLLESATMGKVLIIGEDIKNLTPNEKSIIRNKSIGFVYQFHHLMNDLTAVENVAMPLFIGGVSFSKALEKAKRLLIGMGLEDRINHFPAMLSGGEQQRVAIARSMICKPKIILADEPTGNLDPETSEKVMDQFLINARLNNISMLIVTHNHKQAEKFDRVYSIEKGKIIPKVTDN